MKLTAQELRIGNLVQIVKYWKDFYDENYFIPKEINLDDLRAINNFKDIAKPIPLTEEWLLKFGFEKDKYDYFHHIKSKIIIGHTTTDEFFEYEYLTGFQDSQTEMCELKYIHQLQNLYFALNCQELKLK